MKLETNRLLLKTLDLNLIDAAAKRDAKAIEALGYKTNNEWPEPDFAEALPYFRQLLIQNKGTRGFDSWIMVKKDTNEIVGGIGFLGDPGPEGVIEIGFGTNQSHRRKGYCFEAAQRLLNWAWSQTIVKSIIAKCDSDNIGSRKILTKLGFQLIREEEDVLCWEYCREK